MFVARDVGFHGCSLHTYARWRASSESDLELIPRCSCACRAQVCGQADHRQTKCSNTFLVLVMN
eukprot:1815599-Amphidinium_carterae.1